MPNIKKISIGSTTYDISVDMSTNLNTDSSSTKPPTAQAVKGYVDLCTTISIEMGIDNGGMLTLENYVPMSGKISYICILPTSDYIISGATTGYGFWICYGDSWTDCSSVKWCKNGTWVTCYNSDFYSGGENPVGIYRAGNAIWVKVDYTNTSNNPVAYLLTLPEPYVW